MPFLTPNQQYQSTEGIEDWILQSTHKIAVCRSSPNSSPTHLCVSQSRLNSMDVVKLVITDAVFQHVQITFNANSVNVQCIQLLAILLLVSRQCLQCPPATHNVCNTRSADR